jgi:hypothetical protein
MSVVDLSFHTDDFGRVTCHLSDSDTNAVVTASDRPESVAGLSDAVDRLLTSGISECYWHEAAGEYRWVFRRAGDRVRVAVMWSTGTLCGWEHVFWTECDVDEFAQQVRRGLTDLALTA